MAPGEKEHVARTLEGKLLEVLLLILRPPSLVPEPLLGLLWYLFSSVCSVLRAHRV